MQARFRAFSTQDENFESHYNFWRSVILLVARTCLKTSIVKTEEVRCRRLFALALIPHSMPSKGAQKVQMNAGTLTCNKKPHIATFFRTSV